MPPFRRVDAGQAGPSALGILVPPGRQTVVILRPRALPWDLLPARWNGDPAVPPVLGRFGRDEAASAARRLFDALGEAVKTRTSPVQTIGDWQGRSFQVWLRTVEFVWIVCARTTGKQYQPLVFATLDEARAIGERIEEIVWPNPSADQEVYFNTQNFQATV